MFGNALFAQEIVKPSSIVEKTFTGAFEKAVNVNWGNQNSVFIATFLNDKESSIAFIDAEGNLFAKGRKISTGYLPIAVKNCTQPIQEKFEKRYGKLSLGNVFEIMYTEGMTKYFIDFENDSRALMVVVDTGGNTFVNMNTKNPIYEQQNLDKMVVSIATEMLQ